MYENYTTVKVTVIQKDSSRYTFTKYASGRCTVESQQMMTFGASASSRNVSQDSGNALYKELMAKGFKRFRNVREVSWYATRPNNTEYEETWTVDGDYLVPVVSRVLE